MSAPAAGAEAAAEPARPAVPGDVPSAAGTEDAEVFPTDEDYERIIDELHGRYRDGVSRKRVAKAVTRARSEIEAGAKHGDFLLILIAKRAKDLIRKREKKKGIVPHEVKTLLFVCENNTARSQMAAAIAKSIAGDHIHARTSGRSDHAALDPQARAVLTEQGIDIDAPIALGSVDDLVQAADVVIEIGTHFPSAIGKNRVRWVVPNPHGGDLADYRKCRDELDWRVTALLEDLDLPT